VERKFPNKKQRESKKQVLNLSAVCTAASCTVEYLYRGTGSDSNGLKRGERRCFKIKRAAVKRLTRNYRVPKVAVTDAKFDIKSEIEEKVAAETGAEIVKVLRYNRKPLVVQLNERWERSKDSLIDSFVMEALISEPPE